MNFKQILHYLLWTFKELEYSNINKFVKILVYFKVYQTIIIILEILFICFEISQYYNE
jgi:hypothetical protein